MKNDTTQKLRDASSDLQDATFNFLDALVKDKGRENGEAAALFLNAFERGMPISFEIKLDQKGFEEIKAFSYGTEEPHLFFELLYGEIDAARH